MSPAKIRPFWPNPTKPTHQNPTTATGSCRIPATVAVSHFVIFFFARIKRQKKIFENDFIENILPLKPFYVKTNGILKRRH
jgi:hypothetical protein